MTCASCVGRVDRKLKSVGGLSDVSVNLASETAQVRAVGTEPIWHAIKALDDLGYPVRRDTVTLDVASMTCASCVGRVERTLRALPGMLEVSVNLAAETATVTFPAGATNPDDLLSALNKAGYPATLAKSDAKRQDRSTRKKEEARRLARQVALAAALALPVFVLEMGGHAFPAVHRFIAQTIGHQTSWMLQALLTTFVLIGPGRGFFRIGVPALLKGAPDMNSLVAVGTAAAYGYSMIATFLPSLMPPGLRAVYFEAAAVIIVLILIGRWMEARAKGRTGAAIEKLMGLQPHMALVERNGTFVEVAIKALEEGDLVLVRPGERIAVDGEVVTGESHIDESMISGEALAVAKSPGDQVTGGTVNGAGSLTFRATRVGAQTTLAQIIRMVERAQGSKLPIQGLVDRITLWFVPAVMFIAAATVMVWLSLGPEPTLSHALIAGVSVLIIACPCAMGLATPTSIMVGIGRAAELGVLFRKGDALQHLGAVGIVAFDKTGTITQGRPELTDLMLASGFEDAEVLALVAAAEMRSEHPISEAILRHARSKGLVMEMPAEFAAMTGYGVRAVVGQKTVLVGADRLMAREGVDFSTLAEAELALAQQGKTALFAAIDGRIAAVIGVADPVKPTSRAAIAALKSQGLRVAMITGDKPETAAAIAREVGIDQVVAGVLPAGKVAALESLGKGAKMAFVGDGINDAPALAHADVGIAVGTGTDIAMESADVVLMSGDLAAVANAVDLSRRTMANIRQNLVWAFGYNIALIPVAAGVLYPNFGLLLSPMLAAGAMALSSVFVISNALRLRWIAPAQLSDPKEGITT